MGRDEFSTPVVDVMLNLPLSHLQAMLSFLERVALSKGMDHVFVLSTRTMQWFEERGFRECPLEDLPPVRQAMYNWERRSKVYRKRLQGTRDIDAEELFWEIG